MIGDRTPTPFDGRKVIYHLQYWAPIVAGAFPPPVLVTIDPANACNLRCDWCNAAAVTGRNRLMSDELVNELPGVLAAWGTRAVCVAGGGEPLMHPRVGDLINGIVDSGIEFGVVTNGTLIPRHMAALGRCRWVAVSVDAGSRRTYERIKGVDRFGEVVAAMRALREAHAGLEITYKYLLDPRNINDLPAAAETACSIGVDYMHVRPVARTWMDIRDGRIAPIFDHRDIATALDCLAECRRILGPRLVATTDKVSDAWGIEHRFARCRAVAMTCVIGATGEVGLCCDRRGDERTTLGVIERAEDLPAIWGNDRHGAILDGICTADCPRCTYSPHNELFEAFVDHDTCCKDFI